MTVFAQVSPLHNDAAMDRPAPAPHRGRRRALLALSLVGAALLA